MKYYLKFWRKFYEKTILLEFTSQYFMNHFFIRKISRKGKAQERVIAVSNRVIGLI